MSRQRKEPSELTIAESIERFLGRKRGTKSKATVREYGYRLERFSEFCDDQEIETVGELHPLDFDDYLAYREQIGVAPVTMNSHFKTIRSWVELLESLGAVDDGLSEAIPKVEITKDDEISESKLDVDDGNALIAFYRESEEWYGSRQHALLELYWFTGARLGSIRALDLHDVSLETNAIAFRHRPQQDTPLKNGSDAERLLALPPAVSAVLREYIDHNRHEKRDSHGRQPLLTSVYGRPSPNSIRNWTYQATQPCIRTECPHDKDRATCDWTSSNHASKCPSSRSPHEVRTGAITRMLNKSEKDKVGYRANTSAFRHYDMATEQQKMENRDRDTADALALDDDHPSESGDSDETTEDDS